jgi:hypothetical protein
MVSAAVPVTVLAAPAMLLGKLLALGELLDELLVLEEPVGVLAVPLVPLVPLIAAGGVAAAIVLWVLNDSSTTRPAAVPTIARMTRRMSGAFHQGSELGQELGRETPG